MSDVFYVITIHGIGDQRYNETVLPVINSFAKSVTPDLDKNLVSLGMVNNQTGTISDKKGDVQFVRSANQKLWAEFEGISYQWGNAYGTFDGSASDSGKNFRFVDMFWADLLDADAAHSSLPIGQWTETVIARNEKKRASDEASGDEASVKSRSWLIKLLHIINEVILFVNSFLSFKGKGIQDVVFNKYLSDVQLYGEHLNVRGRAVSRFHRMMERIYEWHVKGEEEKGTNRNPRFIFLAHSLGTVLTMDSLCYAHVDHQKNPMPFPSYHETSDGKKIEYNYDWAKYAHTLITLGSPIDKYIVLWWQNYDYLKDPGLYTKRGNRILHINYTDEQDPVGHKLDKFRATAAYDALFLAKNCERQEVFKRYGIPGKAHIDYWEDQQLTDNLLTNITNPDYNQEDETFLPVKDKPGAYTKAVAISYFVIPFVAAWVVGRLFAGAYSAWTELQPDWEKVGFYSVAFMAAGYFFQKLIRILIFWRVILFSKSKEKGKSESTYYDKGRRRMVRWARLLVLLVLLLAFHLLARPVFIKWGMNDAEILGKYFVILALAYFVFKGLKKLLVPVEQPVKGSAKASVYVASIVLSILLFTVSFLVPPVNWFTSPLGSDGAMVLAFTVFAWLYNMITVFVFKKEITDIM